MGILALASLSCFPGGSGAVPISGYASDRNMSLLPLLSDPQHRILQRGVLVASEFRPLPSQLLPMSKSVRALLCHLLQFHGGYVYWRHCMSCLSESTNATEMLRTHFDVRLVDDPPGDGPKARARQANVLAVFIKGLHGDRLQEEEYCPKNSPRPPPCFKVRWTW